MILDKRYDVAIIGGSYAGLSAAMALGRSLRNVLVIDNGQPCNRQTPHSHNFITHDGRPPHQIAELARQQVEKYKTVEFYKGLAADAVKNSDGFEITTSQGEIFSARKVILANGLKDIMPDIKGISECWGISVLHCPYCHGYEVRAKKTGILGNGDIGFHYAKLISHWTSDLSLFTNGKAKFSEAQIEKIEKHHINVVETEIAEIHHNDGQIEQIIFNDDTRASVEALYFGAPFIQHSDIPTKLGCRTTEQGLIEIDGFQKTNIPGVFACGDNSGMRVVSMAVASGTKAGAAVNFELIEEDF